MLRRISILIIVTTAVFATHRRPVQSDNTLQRLTNTPEHLTSINPSLSDNGAVIAFESAADLVGTGGENRFHGFSKRLGTEEFTEIARGRLVCPGLSSDGATVVFASAEDLVAENPDRNSEIYLFEQSTLTQITHTAPDAAETRLTDGNFQPVISGDGRFIAFFTTRMLVNAQPGIVLFDRSIAEFITVAEQKPSAVLSNPKVSGDGSRVVFLSTNSNDHRSSLCTFNTANHETRLLTTHSGNAQLSIARAVSNDGSRIVLSAESSPGQTQVFLYDDYDGAIRQLTTLPSRNVDVPLNPTISGDGKRVAFATRRRVTSPNDGGVELFVLDLPTGEIHQITHAPAQAVTEVVSSLSYDGSAVVFNFSRLLSGPVTNDDFANNNEIYFSSIRARPAFAPGEAFNAAAEQSISSDTKAFAPDSLVNMKGAAFSATTRHADVNGGRFPSSLAGVSASVNNQPAQVVYISPNEVTVVLPASLSDGPTELVVTNLDGFQIRAPIVVANAAPGLFSFDNLQTGAVLDSARLLASPLDPTSGNLLVTVFGTGMRHARAISAQLNGEAVSVEEVIASNVPGLDEVHLLVPPSFRGVGIVSLTVTADQTSSNEVIFTISGSPIRDLLINEFLADPPDSLAGDANHDGTRSASADEFVELVNTTTRDFNLSGYKLFTRNTVGAEVERHRFANSSIVPAGTAIVVFGGGNPDAFDSIFAGSLVLKASSGGLGLNNGGGAIILKNTANETVCSVTYGPKLGLSADTNESLTRSPDLTGSLTPSSQVNHALFSPGTRVNGSPFPASPAATRIEVLASRNRLVVGESLELRAMAFDSHNDTLADVLFSWQVVPTNIATVDSNGLVTALRSGSANVIATARGVSSEPFQLVVSQPTPTPTATPTPTPSPTQTPTPTPTPGPTPFPSGMAPVVISEFRTRGPNGASDEFVEIYNRTQRPIDLSGWKVKGSNSAGSVATRVVISPGTVLPPFCHYLMTHASGYMGETRGDQTYSNGLVNDGGIALTLPNDAVVDQVGLSLGSAFVEGTQLAPLTVDTNQSYERKPGGVEGSSTDTDDNVSDFRVAIPSDPQNRDSIPTPGPTPSPSVSPSPGPTASPAPSPSPTPTVTPTPAPSPNPSTRMHITQVYGGGGNSGALFRNDFIEILNAGPVPVDLTGWSVQYASATSANWSVTTLTSIVLSPGQHYLVQQASGGTNGAALPSPDAVGTIALAATAGKVALVRTTLTLSGECPASSDVLDLVGYGSTSNCFRGAGPAPAASNTNAIHRSGNGCVDTQNNLADFGIAAPSPRNSSAEATVCLMDVNVGDNVRTYFSLTRSMVHMDHETEPCFQPIPSTPDKIEYSLATLLNSIPSRIVVEADRPP